MFSFKQFKRYLIYILKSKKNIDKSFQEFDKKNIDEIFRYFNTDKATSWNEGRDIGHGYSEFYEKHLKIFKHKKINVLEIGSYSGASAASFVKYFPLSNIYCLDINLTNFKYLSEKIKVFGLDVSKKWMINKFYNKINISQSTEFFDIIIDDGSHKLSDILVSLNTFYRNLKPGGFYILEEFKFPNYYPHLDDCSENKIDEILISIKNKKFFSSKLVTDEIIKYILNSVKNVSIYRGSLKNSDIAFIEKL